LNGSNFDLDKVCNSGAPLDERVCFQVVVGERDGLHRWVGYKQKHCQAVLAIGLSQFDARKGACSYRMDRMLLLFVNPKEKMFPYKSNGALPRRICWLLVENVTQLLMSVPKMKWPLNQTIGPMFIRLGLFAQCGGDVY
jgi:hypothetical protein